MISWKSALIGLASAVFFSLFYITGIFRPLEERVYDLYLRFRPNRERYDNVVFLDVDDKAIAYNGVFPWPRSVSADGLLRLKEYGAAAAIFDIEFIDRGPQGVDEVYLNQGFSEDFDRSFREINSYASSLFSAVNTGRVNRSETSRYASELSRLITEERDTLFTRARSIVRDNDEYLARASALFGYSWATLNLRSYPLEGEQAERRPLTEELFSYPIDAAPGAHEGSYVDVLPALPSFSRAAQGAGYTNVDIDGDGVRRRIHLAQRVDDHWYLQLAFAPLIHYLGSPEIKLEPRRLTIKNPQLPGAGPQKDIVIPLDSRGRMMLDWPATDYNNSYTHISFAEFSLLEELEFQMEQYTRSLAASDISYFTQFDASLYNGENLLIRSGELFDAAREMKARALASSAEGAAEQAGEEFTGYVEYRAETRALIRELLNLDIGAKVNALALALAAESPENAAAVTEEADYIATLADYTGVVLDRYEEIATRMAEILAGTFCILGRVDTGTTDIGVNPFWGEYVNVGTHAVVLDTILSRSFINQLPVWWSILISLLLIPLFFLFTNSLTPGVRTALGFTGTAVLLGASVILFAFTGNFFGPLGPALAMIAAVIIREILSYAGSEREKQFIRKAFSTYVSGDVVKEIIADPSRLQLGGSKRFMSAIFTDIKGFSTISEYLDPEDQVSLLNRYLTAMSDAILLEKGTIDKYEGDAIIAFFGAPLELPDHALRACVSAIAMKRIERELNKTVLQNKLSPTPLLTRIGINTGSMVAGNMGTENKMNYTIMGNAVNLAARLEGVNKQYGTWILASGDTVHRTEGRLLSRRLDRVRVVGINEPVQLYELVETADGASPEMREKVRLFHEALEFFENRQWKQAREGFNAVLSLDEDPPSALYLKRCETYLETPPGVQWDGIFNINEK